MLVPTLFTLTLSTKQLITGGEKQEVAVDDLEEISSPITSAEEELELGAGVR